MNEETILGQTFDLLEYELHLSSLSLLFEKSVQLSFQMFTSARSVSSAYSGYNSKTKSGESSPPHQQLSVPESNPIQIAVLTGKQEIKLKTKQNDTLHGPKVCASGL